MKFHKVYLKKELRKTKAILSLLRKTKKTMKSTFFILLIMLFVACKEKKDMDLCKSTSLNDSSHIGNLEIEKQKKEIFKGILDFDKWYREEHGGIVYWNNKWQMNGYCYACSVPDKKRISLIKDTIVPKVADCPYITQKLKEKVEYYASETDPGCLGRMLTANRNGDNIRKFTSVSTPDERLIFHFEGYLNDYAEYEKLRSIPYEEALFYHLSMIKIYDDNKAVYRVARDILYADENGGGYLIIEMKKSNKSWLVNDMYFLNEEELVDIGERHGILNYFSSDKP